MYLRYLWSHSLFSFERFRVRKLKVGSLCHIMRELCVRRSKLFLTMSVRAVAAEKTMACRLKLATALSLVVVVGHLEHLAL